VGWLTPPAWREIQIYREFVLQIPDKTMWQNVEGGRALVLRLPTRPVTEILVSRHPLPQDWEVMPYLLTTVRSFFSEVVRAAAPECLVTSVERLVEDVYQWDGVQGVASHTGEDICWLVRAFGVGSDYLWLQWTGPKELIKEPVLRIIESLRAADPDSAALSSPVDEDSGS
jgi:hypothetical protein